MTKKATKAKRSEASVTLNFLIEYGIHDPDGTPCFACGDIIYLTGLEVVVRLSGQNPQTVACLCQSCADAIQPDVRQQQRKDHP